ncbi:DUF305 domain-containing protein [Streptomyces sp. NPDC048182]|uniref:DUF305 domain-containing protein n=1 Tax=Streptomyces sp. NPDC048182 TaxID=3365507 RepID=UPI003723AD90
MQHIRTLTRRTALAAATATAALVLAACGGDGGHDGAHGTPSASPASPEAGAQAHNAQDVAFAQGMVPHHRQALEMAGMASGRAASAKVKDLAARIEKAQDPEITTMTGWLTAWGEKVPGTAHSEHSDGMSGMTGMMDDQDMTDLEKASGAEFDRMFLSLMVEHHEGAVEMATTEQSAGRYGPANKLAGEVVTAQQGEIAEMKALLGKG